MPTLPETSTMHTTAVTDTTATLPPVGFTVAEAAARLGCSPWTVYRLVRRGTLPHTRAGGPVRIPRAALAAYLKRTTSRTWAPADGRGSGTRGRRRTSPPPPTSDAA